MAAQNTDKLKKLAKKWTGQVGSGGVTDAVVTTIPLSSTTNLPTDTAVIATIDRVDVNGTATPTLEEAVIGVVSGSNLISCVRATEGTAQAHSAGAVVEILVTAKGYNDICDWGLVEHSQLGVHSSALVTTLKASGANVTTGTSDVTIVTPKALADAGFVAPAVTLTNVATLTNKRITPRVVTATDDATAVIDCDVTDQYQLTAVANATEFTVTGTPTNGQKLLIRLKDAGVAKGLTWTGFTAIGCTAPTTTVAGKTHWIGAVYNSTTPTWNILAVAVEA